jgi:hypothetical protein
MKFENNENVFWPRKSLFIDILILSAWSFISGLIWSIVLLLIVFLTSWFIDIPGSFDSKMTLWWNSTIFPFLLAFITFFVTLVTSISTYFFSNIIDNLKFKRTLIHFWQISFFSILSYVFLTPIYLYVGLASYNDIMLVFIFHVLFLSFWVSVLLEILNNYRYILLGFYASIVWLFLSSIVILLIFFSFETWFAKLVSLLVILPISNWLLTLFKWIFEYLYYLYFKFTWLDQLWDIFHQLEEEEQEQLREAVDENSTF